MSISKSPSSIPDEPDAGGGNRPRNQGKDADGDGHLKSRVIKRSLVVGGHKTSVSLEDVFWKELRAMAHERHLHLSQLAGAIDAERQYCNLSSAIRLFVFENRCKSKSATPQQNATQNDSARTQSPHPEPDVEC